MTSILELYIPNTFWVPIAILSICYLLIFINILLDQDDYTIPFNEKFTVALMSPLGFSILYIYYGFIPNVFLCIYLPMELVLSLNYIIWLIITFLFFILLILKLKSRRTSIIHSIKESKKEEEKNTEIIIKTKIDKLSEDLKEWKINKRYDFQDYKSITEFLEENEGNTIRYNQLLNLYEWKIKRYTILLRDRFTCQDCKKTDINNHVHHLYYVRDEFPWQISDDGLIVLCKDCHISRHQKEIIKVKEWNFNTLFDTNERFFHCPRCNGTGYLPHFSHVENGICFLCMGKYTNSGIFINAINKVKEYGYSEELLFKNFKNAVNKVDKIFFKNYISGVDYDRVEEPNFDEDLPF
jgi:hypothetical protein